MLDLGRGGRRVESFRLVWVIKESLFEKSEIKIIYKKLNK